MWASLMGIERFSVGPLEDDSFSNQYSRVKVFENGPSKICGRQRLKNFTWSILEYFVPNIILFPIKKILLSRPFISIPQTLKS